MQYLIEDNNLVIKIPLKTRRYNPYDNKEGEEMDNVVGIVDKGDCGFGYWIDRDYKNKGDDNTGIIYQWSGNKEEFETFCKVNKIVIISYFNIRNN